jgi:cytochrome oxidase assembly protein ShyY1
MPPRRRFQFRLRTLTIGVTFVAITAGILTSLGPPIVERRYVGAWEDHIQYELNWPAIAALTAAAIALILAIRAISRST